VAQKYEKQRFFLEQETCFTHTKHPRHAKRLPAMYYHLFLIQEIKIHTKHKLSQLIMTQPHEFLLPLNLFYTKKYPR